MTSYTTLPSWPSAYQETGATAVLKEHNADFVVTEIPLGLPSGEGEHVWLDVEKNGANTQYVAAQIAEFAGVRELDVGYAGLKDRYAITRQWFSVWMPKTQEPDFTSLNHPEFKIHSQARHIKKLRPGDLMGNHFDILLREVEGDRVLIEHNLTQIKEHGVPNYFGPQRFGQAGDNVANGYAMLNREIRVRNKKKKGIYLSAVRSFIFNEVLAYRIQNQLWGKQIPGDVLDEQGVATGPMWGRGRPTTQDEALSIEDAIAGQHASLCEGLEFSGLNQDRRALAAVPENLLWSWPETSQLRLTFSLPAGYYATSLIRECVETTEPERYVPQ
ncbi:MAG: tRNA pseudouridine(13) synthase TruD [Pseudomonadota bacterium]|nr:tRNA pseudouridine(13) synthase TruD [Pseudomonadota bacterium]MEE2748428.1 tRNA pseudouridine(13) synthase TruD [Pseudomonadota bacterium]